MTGLQDNFLGNSIFILCIRKYYSKEDPQISPEINDSMDKSVKHSLSSKESIHLTELRFGQTNTSDQMTRQGSRVISPF